MRLGRAVDEERMRRRAGSALRVFCRRDRSEISLRDWIKGMFFILFENFAFGHRGVIMDCVEIGAGTWIRRDNVNP